MANGDQAGAAGLSVVPSTADVRLGYDAINKRGDELANHMVNGGHAFTKITGQLAAGQLGASVVSTANLADGAVSEAKLAALSVSLGKLAANSVNGSKIIDGSITAAELQRKYAAGTSSSSPGSTTTVDTGLGAGVFAPTVTLLGVTSEPEKASAVIVDVNPSNGTFRYRVATTSGSVPTFINVTWTAVQY